MKQLSKKNSKTLLFLGLILIIYIPYILSVGFSQGDDFFHVNFIEKNSNIIENIKLNLSISPARPVGSIILGFTHSVVKNNIVIYNLISLILWISSAVILKNTFKILINKEFSKIFLVIFSFPYICFSIFIGNTMWSGYILFVFFWAISFNFQIKSYFENKIFYYLTYLLFLTLAIFTFELIIPLLIINLLIPIVFKISRKKIILNFIIITLISLLFLFYKNFYLPFFYDAGIYGYSELNFKNFLQSIYFLYSISIENLIFLLSSLKNVFNFYSFLIFLIIFFLFRDFKKHQKISKHFIFMIFMLSLITCSLIFFISGYPSVTYGHYNKTLVPAFLCFSFIVTYLFLYFEINKFFIIIFIFLISNSTFLQIKNYSDVTKIKKKIINNLVSFINKNGVKNKDTILVNSPLFLKNNFNNEEIIFTTWDFKFRVLNKTKMNLNFWLINERMANDPSFYPVANFMNSGFFNDNSKNNQKLFYFEYDRKIFNFEKMKNKEIVKKKIEQIRVKKINSDEIILREKIRLKMKSYILKFIN